MARDVPRLRAYRIPSISGGDQTLNILFSIIGAVAFIAGVMWVVRVCMIDAQRRGKKPLLIAFLILVTVPMGLILWIVFRPDPTNGASVPFRLEDHRVQ